MDDDIGTAAVVVDRLARIEEKLDASTGDRRRLDKQLSEHDRRLDRVERFMWLAVGMAAASGVPDAIKAVTAAKGA